MELYCNLALQLCCTTLPRIMTENSMPVHGTNALVPLHQGVRRGEARVLVQRLPIKVPKLMALPITCPPYPVKSLRPCLTGLPLVSI